jgi:S1-C subfamily serine protease
MRSRSILGLILFVAAALGAAIPSSGAEPAQPSRGWLGVLLGDAVDGGVELVAVAPGGPADRAGLRRGDLVVRAGEREVTCLDDLEAALSSRRAGQALAIELLRQGHPVSVTVELGRRGDRAGFFAPVAPPAPALPARVPRVESPSAAYGLQVTDVTPDLRQHFGAPRDAGVLVTAVTPGRPAEIAGIRAGDVIVQMDEHALADVADVQLVPDAMLDEIAVGLVRGDQPWAVTLLAPSDTGAAPDPPAVSTESHAGARAALARAVRAEIRRLRARIEELELQLEELGSAAGAAPRRSEQRR